MDVAATDDVTVCVVEMIAKLEVWWLYKIINSKIKKKVSPLLGVMISVIYCGMGCI